MELGALPPPERLALLPWLPDPNGVALSAEEADVLRRARVAAGDTAAPPIALQTPFAGLSVPPIDGLPACVPPPLTYWQPRPDDMPAPKAPDPAYALRQWQEAVTRLAFPADQSFHRRYAALVGLAQTHARCLALSGQPDIPLLQSRRLWSALTACLWTVQQEDAPADELALLVADLSGIQPYLFGTTNFGVGGVARSLRARSFFLSQITALFAWHLLDRLGLPHGNLLLDAGGKFTLLFAPTPHALAIVEEARCAAAAWCLNHLHGELALNAAWVRFPTRALTDGSFSAVLQNANRAIALEKQQRLGRALITETGEWNEAAFVRPNPFMGQAPCRACRRFEQVREAKCALCLRDVEIGKSLTRAAWLAYEPGQGNDTDAIGAFGWRVQVGQAGQVGAKDKPPPQSASWVLALDPAVSLPESPLPARRLARYVPTEQDGRTPLDFAAMSQKAQGRPYLAYLKADVDRLGERFVFGFRDREGGHTLPRVSHLSGALDEFFSGWLETTLRLAFPHCYTVFSGGDDLTVIGPHDQILRLSRLLPRAFRRFQGYEEGSPLPTDALTLSAGIALATSRRPVATAVKLAEDALEEAKEAGRCRVCVFDRPLTWEDYEQLLGKLWQPDGRPTEFGLELVGDEQAARKPEVPSAFVYHLLRYARMWEGYRQGQREQLHYQPLLAYDIGRNIDARKTPHTYRWAGWLAQIHLNDGGNWREAMDNLGVFARIVLLHRKGQG